MKIIALSFCLLVGMCSVSGNGISLGVEYADPQTGAVFDLRTAK